MLEICEHYQSGMAWFRTALEVEPERQRLAPVERITCTLTELAAMFRVRLEQGLAVSWNLSDPLTRAALREVGIDTREVPAKR